MVAADIGGVDSAENRSAAFGFSEAWANGVDGGVARRLNDEEAREVRDLVVRYHVESIRKASQSTENAETVIGAAIAESEENNCVDNNVLESVAIALQDTVRHVNMAVTATEVVEKLGLEQDPDIRVIFHPLILSYTRFVASFSNDAILFLRGARRSAHEGEETSVLSDDLLFGLCVAIGLLRAAGSRCIAGRARFLLDLAADRARGTDDEDPLPKRRRHGSDFGRGRSSQPNAGYETDGLPPSEETRGEKTNILLACLALSRSDHDDGRPDGRAV